MKRNRRSGAGKMLSLCFAAAAALCVIPVLQQAVTAQADTPGCSIVLTPSAPAADNGNPDVYGYYNRDSEVSVGISVRAAGDDAAGIRRIEYWITDGTEDPNEAIETHILYEDNYEAPEEPAAAEEPAAPAIPEEPAEPEAPEEPETPEEPKTPVEPEATEEPEEPDEAAQPAEPEAPAEPEEPEASEDIDDPEDDETEGPDDPEDGDEEEPDDPEDGDEEEPDDPEDGGEDFDDPEDEDEDKDEDDPDEEESDDSEDEEEDEEGADDPDEEDGEDADESDEEDGEDEEDPEEEDEEDEDDPEEEDEEEDEDDSKEEDEEDPDVPGEQEGEGGLEDPGAEEEPDETEAPAEPDEPAEPETPAEPEEPEEPEAPAVTEEPEAPAVTEEPEPYRGLASWDGLVTVDTARWNTGEVQVHVRATDLAGTVKEASVQLNIDISAPGVAVRYDNNAVQNGQYFNAPRTATVVITERNFDPSLVNFTMTAQFAEDDETSGTSGSDGTVPTVSWVHDGDVHTATICFTADGDYTFDVSVTDRAGNRSGAADFGDSAAAGAFTIDRSEPEVQILGVEDSHGYRGTVAPTVRVYDRALSDWEVTLTRTRLDEIDVDVTDRFFPAREMSSMGGTLTCSDMARVRDNDGIYTLRVTAEDLAGNESREEVTFSVNRFGSVYVFGDYLVSLIRNGGVYTQEIEQDLVITEYNADRLVPGSLLIDITRDGRPMADVICSLSPVPGASVSAGSRGWYEYRYVIDKDNFTADGVYKMSVSSEDEAGNTPDNSEATGMDILFRVDSTAPEISGNAKAEDSGSQSDGEDFEYFVYDTIGLKTLDVYVNGEVLGDGISDFGEDMNFYTGTITLEAAAAGQTVRLVATDLAGNVSDRDFRVPAGTRTLQERITSPVAALEQLAEEGILLPVALGAAAAAAVILILLLVMGRVRKK